LFRKPNQTDHLEDTGTEGWITLKLIYKKQDGRHGFDLSGSRYAHTAGYCRHGEPLGVIKCGEFVSYPRNYQLLKKDCTALS
jgi:hypothetical protein